MKPIWRETKIVQVDCGKKERCSVVVPISSEPITECPKGGEDNASSGNFSQMREMRQGEEVF